MNGDKKSCHRQGCCSLCSQQKRRKRMWLVLVDTNRPSSLQVVSTIQVCVSFMNQVKSASGFRVSRLSSQLMHLHTTMATLFHYKAWKLVNVCAVCHFLWILAGNQAKWKENPERCSLHCPPHSEVGWAEIRSVKRSLCFSVIPA